MALKKMLSLKLVQNLVIFQKPIKNFYLRIFRGNFPSGSANLAIQKQRGLDLCGPIQWKLWAQKVTRPGKHTKKTMERSTMLLMG